MQTQRWKQDNRVLRQHDLRRKSEAFTPEAQSSSINGTVVIHFKETD